MKIQDAIRFASENPTCFIATNEDGQPRVRTVLLMRADNEGFFFETTSVKEFSKQLHKNPKVELCFYNYPENIMEAIQLRISGEVQYVTDNEIINEIYEKIRPLSEAAGVDMRPNFEVFFIASGEAHFWTMQDVGREAQIEKIIF